jgi:hypothetical protein
MDSIEKLRRLIPHWQEHNREHAESYRRWAEEARLAGCQKVADTLERLYRETIRIDALFDEAREEVEKYAGQRNI